MKVDYGKLQKLTEWLATKIKLDANSSSSAQRLVYRGQVYECYLGENIGSEETKKRPVVILQNNTGNKYSPNVIVAPITNTKGIPAVTVTLTQPVVHDNGVDKLTGHVLLANIVTVSKARLDKLLVSKFPYMKEVDEKIITSLALYEKTNSLNKQIEVQKKRAEIFKRTLDELTAITGTTDYKKIKDEVEGLQKRIAHLESETHEEE